MPQPWTQTLEWLLAATTRARAAVELLTFVYRDPGSHGDDRAYLIRRGRVRACYAWPATPIEQEAFRGVVKAEVGREDPIGPLEAGIIEEMLLVMSWFRRHPEALHRTTRVERQGSARRRNAVGRRRHDANASARLTGLRPRCMHSTPAR